MFAASCFCVHAFARRSSDLEASSVEASDVGDEVGAPGGHGKMEMPYPKPGILELVAFSVFHLHGLGRLGPLLRKLSAGPVRFASLCSGLEVFTMVFLALESAFDDLPDLTLENRPQFIHELSCELDDSKRALCTKISPSVQHVYKDVVELSSGCAYDYVHKRKTRPDAPDVMAAGFSCKDLSGMRRTGVKFVNNMSNTSGRTFYACAACAKEWKPSIVIYENVKGLVANRSADRGLKPIDAVDETMRELGYLGAHRLVDSSHYALPQRRSRVWLIYFKTGCGDARVAINSMKMFETQMLPLKQILDKSPSAPLDAPAASKGMANKRQWREKVSNARKKLKLKPKDCSDMQKLLEQSNPSFRARTPRVRANLAVQYLRAKNQGLDFAKVPIVFQTDQDLPRQPRAVAKVPCICPSGSYWLASGCLSSHRYLSARELARLQGVGEQELAVFRLRGVSDSLLRDLAGNAFSGPVCAAAVLSALLSWERLA